MSKSEENIDDAYIARSVAGNTADFNLQETIPNEPPLDNPPSGAFTQSTERLQEEPPKEESPKRPPEEEPSMTWMMLREVLETVVLSLIIFLLMRQVVQNYRIESQSMEPNFCEGQFILVNKLAYVLGEPKRGDVVVFNNPSNQDEDYIKRIIGLPGDTLTIRNEQVFINGVEEANVIKEPYLRHQIPERDNIGPLVIEPDRLWVMGDNRPNSSDSRGSVGQLSQDLLVGKAWLRVWPFDRWGLVQHFALEPGVPLTDADAVPDAPCP